MTAAETLTRPVEAATNPTARGHLPALDGVRAIAVLLVLLFHYELRRWPWRHGPGLIVGWVVNAGWSGVDLFFVLSGFLITGILWRGRHRPHYFRNFYARRTLRIFPLYYATLFVLFVLWPSIPGASAVDPRPAFATQAWFWTYTCNVLLAVWGWNALAPFTGHFWSLAIEEQFYLVWPAVLRRLTLVGAMALCAVAIAAALAFRSWLVFSRHNPLAAFSLTPARMDSLAVGALIALIAERPGGLAWLVRRSWILLAVGGLGVVGLVAWRGTIGSLDPGVASVGYTVIACAWGTFLIAALADGIIARVLSHPILQWVGRRSYAIYVLHYPIVLACDQAGLTVNVVSNAVGSFTAGHAAFVALNLAMTFGGAELSWRLVESPLLRLKDRFG